jgi:hypothetical protein
VTADDSQFGYSGKTLQPLKTAIHIVVVQSMLQYPGHIIIAGQPYQDRSPAQRADIESDIAGATGTTLLLIYPHHRHRRLRRDAAGVAMPIAIKHYIAYHEDSYTAEIW